MPVGYGGNIIPDECRLSYSAPDGMEWQCISVYDYYTQQSKMVTTANGKTCNIGGLGKVVRFPLLPTIKFANRQHERQLQRQRTKLKSRAQMNRDELASDDCEKLKGALAFLMESLHVSSPQKYKKELSADMLAAVIKVSVMDG